jgi:hypothetical protein
MKFTPEEIKAMAREAEFGELQTNLSSSKFERFAALVAEAERKRADALAATIAALRDVVTTDAETKGEFVSRVRAVLGEDPDARVLGAVLAERKACGTVKADKPPRRYKGAFQSIFEDGIKWGAASVRANIRALK